MIKKRALNLLLTVSLSANAMVIVTWIITKALGDNLISPTYLFKNIIAAVAITGVSTMFGWVYSKSINPLIIGSIHFFITAITFVICGLWAQWFPSDGGVILTGLLIFIVIFMIIWVFHYFYWKNQIKKINARAFECVPQNETTSNPVK